MSFSGPVEDRLLIRERFGAYSDATFRGDVEAWLANYTEDGAWILMGTPIKGKAALRVKWTELWTRLERMAFFTEIGAIEIDGARATTRSYCREITHYKNGTSRKLVGKYEDQLVRANGIWLFAERRYHLLDDEGFIQPK